MYSTALPVSILDRANSRAGQPESEALHAVIERARHAESLGYRRFWVAEHHGVPGIAGSAPAVLMAAVAAHTTRIRVGSGGIMLPNHQPLVVAEQVATLEALYPGRIDLGIGRSVGFTPAVRAALRQDKEAGERFEDDLAELMAYLSGGAGITARPADEGATPLFVLATGEGVDIAARAGLAVVLGGPALFKRTADAPIHPVIERYRSTFRSSSWYAKPYVMVSVNVAVAQTTRQARQLLLPEAWALAQARTRGEFPPLAPATDIAAGSITSREQTLIEENLSMAVFGTAAEVAEQLESLIRYTGADELLVTGGIHDRDGQADSDRRLAELLRISGVPG